MKTLALALLAHLPLLTGHAMAGTFSEKLTELLHPGMTLAPELVQTFDWLEEQGWMQVRKGGQPEDHWLSIYPAHERDLPSASHVVFGGTTLPFTHHWSTPDSDIDARIAEIATTSGDGGRAALWLDENGKQQFVHLGHDNMGLLTDDPLVFLQFLGIGYPEPGALTKTGITPDEQFEQHGTGLFSGDTGPIYPVAFQKFLKDRFDLDMPATAQELGIKDFQQDIDDASTNPFVRWVIAVTPEPTEAELAYEMELMRTVESLDIKDDDDPDTVMQKIGSLFQSEDKNK